jgi:hypothetical protein
MKHGKWTWLSWILVGIILLSALIDFVAWLMLQSGSSSFHSWVSALGWGVVLPAVCSVVAALIIARQPGNRVGWLLMVVGLVAVFPSFVLEAMSSPPSEVTPGIFLLVWLDGWSWIPIIFPIFLIPLNFPTGRPPTPRWNWVNWLALGMWLFFIFFSPFINTITPNNGQWSLPNPIGFIPDAVAEGPFIFLWGTGLLTLVSASVVSLFVRYRRAQYHERQQIQWLLYAGALFVIVYGSSLVIANIDTQFSGLNNLLLLLSILAIPVAIAIAILRYRLYDIDVIIRKTLQYGVVTVLLLLVYVGSVVLLQSLVENLTGEQSPIVIVISTLAIAALFNPLRSRVQDFIDRRFYRKKYNAEKALADFASTARDEVEMDKLTAALLGVMEETLQPETAVLWLKKIERSTSDER